MYIYIYIYIYIYVYIYLENIINETLDFIHEWISNNRLHLNIEKTNFILFHRSRINLNKKSNDLIIKKSIYILFFSIFIDENLNWKKQKIILNPHLIGISL